MQPVWNLKLCTQKSLVVGETGVPGEGNYIRWLNTVCGHTVQSLRF